MPDRYDMIVYHGGCTDGWCSAYIAARAGNPAAELVPASYGQEPPDMKGKKVLIVDFSYKRDVLHRMASEADQITVLDHHKTAQEDLSKTAGTPHPWNLFVHFDLSKCGARLTWEHFHPGEKAPSIVDYVEDRDLWRWQYHKSRDVNAAIRSYPMEFQFWDELRQLCETEPSRLIREGEAILRYQNQVVADHVKHAVDKDVAGHVVPSVNATVLFSEIAGELAKGKPFACAWFVRADGKTVHSLRSDENGLDVSEVAKSMGGGGHPRAAGFEK